jgi:hypothetical protein
MEETPTPPLPSVSAASSRLIQAGRPLLPTGPESIGAVEETICLATLANGRLSRHYQAASMPRTLFRDAVQLVSRHLKQVDGGAAMRRHDGSERQSHSRLSCVTHRTEQTSRNRHTNDLDASNLYFSWLFNCNQEEYMGDG